MAGEAEPTFPAPAIRPRKLGIASTALAPARRGAVALRLKIEARHIAQEALIGGESRANGVSHGGNSGELVQLSKPQCL
jgi:hypothetical protein